MPLVIFISFWKVDINENVRIVNHASGIRLPDCFESAINREDDNDVIIFGHDIMVFFFDVLVFSSRLVTVSNFMSISILILDLWQFFNKELTRNPEI